MPPERDRKIQILIAINVQYTVLQLNVRGVASGTAILTWFLERVPQYEKMSKIAVTAADSFTRLD